MKLIYSHLQKFLPDLQVEPQQLRDDLTMIGHFCNFYEEIEGEIVFDLDIKVNRGDCFGYYGLARDLAVQYNIPLQIPKILEPNYPDYQLPIKVTSPDVNRVMCLKLSEIKVSPSPDWLVKFSKIHQVNTINNVVDLTNYIMFLYGIPGHAFDVAKTGENLIWENNQGKTTEFITLDGTLLNLTDDNLVISNPQEVVSTDFVGGKNSGTYDSTTDVIIEVATYNPVRIRQDSRHHKTSTEAGTRLEKMLDSNLVPQALHHLAQLIVELCNAKISSQVYDYFPPELPLTTIEFDFALPTRLAGIEIPEDFIEKTLISLNCVLSPLVKEGIKGRLVIPPSVRKDISLPEDLAEEIIRFYGYQKIPVNEPVKFKEVPNITPKILYLIDQLKDKLVSEGYDEVLTWPLVSQPVDPKTVVKTENSINSESIYLRQSLIPSLQKQLEQYQKYKLPHPKFFEIGKIFSKDGDKFIEKYALGTYDGEKFQETILDDIPAPESYIPSSQHNTAIELTSQIITLDANVIINDHSEPVELIKQYSAKIDPRLLWSMEITDIFENKYTFRVNYYNCDDKTAKKIHLSAFNLTTEKYAYVDPKAETELLYYVDMFQTETKATVIAHKNVDGHNYLILDKTLFFPEGGGQPSDTGTIDDQPVISLKFKDGQVWHEVKEFIEVGAQVDLKIDCDHRYRYMKIHSAGHLLHEVLLEINPTLKPLKGYHGNEAYLIYEGQMAASDTSKIEELFQKRVEENLPILCDYTDLGSLAKDARSIPKNIPLHKPLRRLKIGNYPSMADGGIQVKTTKEIGGIKIIKIENQDNQSTIYYQML